MIKRPQPAFLALHGFLFCEAPANRLVLFKLFYVSRTHDAIQTFRLPLWTLLNMGVRDSSSCSVRFTFN